jgi:hypothetical protein
MPSFAPAMTNRWCSVRIVPEIADHRRNDSPNACVARRPPSSSMRRRRPTTPDPAALRLTIARKRARPPSTTATGPRPASTTNTATHAASNSRSTARHDAQTPTAAASPAPTPRFRFSSAPATCSDRARTSAAVLSNSRVVIGGSLREAEYSDESVPPGRLEGAR